MFYKANCFGLPACETGHLSNDNAIRRIVIDDLPKVINNSLDHMLRLGHILRGSIMRFLLGNSKIQKGFREQT